jgi:hypothetical protein
LLQVGGGTPTPTPTITSTPTEVAETSTPTATPTPAPTSAQSLPGPATPIGLSGRATATGALDPLQASVTGTCQANPAADGGTLRISGSVASLGSPVANYHIVVTAVTPDGDTIPVADTTYLTQIFQFQRRVDASGTYVIRVAVEKAGYAGGRAGVRLSC